MTPVRDALLGVLLVCCAVWPVEAQRAPSAGTPGLFLGVGAFDYSLREDGRSAMFVARFEDELGDRVIGEAGFVYARVRQPGSDDATNYLVPELHVQSQLMTGRFAPYLGAGGGVALDFRPDSLHMNATASAAIGFRVWLSDVLALRSEFRVRGVGGSGDGGGTARELSIGALLRLVPRQD